MTTIKSNIPEINVLVDTSQSDEKLYFLNKISPEIPDIDHKLEAKLANNIPRNFIFSFIVITLQNFFIQKKMPFQITCKSIFFILNLFTILKI